MLRCRTRNGSQRGSIDTSTPSRSTAWWRREGVHACEPHDRVPEPGVHPRKLAPEVVALPQPRPDLHAARQRERMASSHAPLMAVRGNTKKSA